MVTPWLGPVISLPTSVADIIRGTRETTVVVPLRALLLMMTMWPLMLPATTVVMLRKWWQLADLLMATVYRVLLHRRGLVVR